MASTESNGFEGVDYSEKIIEFFNDSNYTDYNDYSHPKMEGVMFFNKNV